MKLESKSLGQWLREYGQSHQNPTNRFLHKICVPVIFFTILAMLWCWRIGDLPMFYPVVILAMAFYLRLGKKAALLMLVQIAVMGGILTLWSATGKPVFGPSLVLFAIAWVGQFVGHHIEGHRPSFFQDLQFLLIGPLWVFSFLFKKEIANSSQVFPASN